MRKSLFFICSFMSNHVNHTNLEEATSFDYVFIGLGAGNGLMLLSLIKRGLLNNKKVAIIEASAQTKNDKTYCFWSEADATIVNDLSPIISHHYQSIQVNQTPLQNIANHPYYYIRSIDFYNHTLEKVNAAQFAIIRDAVTTITPEHAQYVVETTQQTLRAAFIFDSRPPNINALQAKHIHLHQSFYGVHIRCAQACFNPHAFNMMNFQVEQNGYTQFIYVLPFSSTEALVELTRFGKDKIEQHYANPVLNQFILEHYGLYTVLENESGCIPMTNYRHSQNPMQGILNTGASANLIKPSTGYGFKRMHIFAETVAEQLHHKSNIPFNQLGAKTKPRFSFYDTLLLIILFYWPHFGKPIFSTLFKRNRIQTIFAFLDEQTKLKQEVPIFASLPLMPFLKAVFVYIKNKQALQYVFATLACLLYAITHYFEPQWANLLIYAFLTLGFLWVGIPHGALDHMLVKQPKSSLLPFILKYLAIMGIYFLCWHYFSFVSLIIFVLFSSFHFGESELEEMQGRSSYLEASVLGFCILMALIGSHADESIQVVSAIKALPFSLQTSHNTLKGVLQTTAFVSFLYLILKGIRTQNQAYAGIIFLLLLGIKMPLMLAFGLYFICQHSINAWRHLQTGLQLKSRDLYWKGLPYTLGAVGFLALFFVVDMSRYITVSGMMGLVFVFLACISLPHFILMHLFYKAGK